MSEPKPLLPRIDEIGAEVMNRLRADKAYVYALLGHALAAAEEAGVDVEQFIRDTRGLR